MCMYKYVCFRRPRRCAELNRRLLLTGFRLPPIGRWQEKPIATTFFIRTNNTREDFSDKMEKEILLSSNRIRGTVNSVCEVRTDGKKENAYDKILFYGIPMITRRPPRYGRVALLMGTERRRQFFNGVVLIRRRKQPQGAKLFSAFWALTSHDDRCVVRLFVSQFTQNAFYCPSSRVSVTSFFVFDAYLLLFV